MVSELDAKMLSLNEEVHSLVKDDMSVTAAELDDEM